MALTKVSRNLLNTSIADNGTSTAITIASDGSVTFSSTISASGYNPTNWNTAYGWGDHSTQSYATQSYVNTQVANLVDTAPSTLDTLNELASALGDDANFSTTVTNSIGTKWTQDNAKISNWDTAYSWGNHASVGYLTSHQDISGKLNTSGGSLSGNLTVSYTGNSTNDAGVYVSNDASDWGIKVQKASGADYGLLVESNGNNALVARNSSGTEYFKVQASGSAQISGNTVWHTGNDGSGSGLDADTVDGFHASTTANSANTIPVRNSNGYTYLGWINTTSGNTTSTIDRIYASNDGFIRYVTPATLKSQLNLMTTDSNHSFTGALTSTNRSNGIFGSYDSYKTDHIWSMGTNFKNNSAGSNFGNLYGLAYKHTNNSTGGTMGGSHQMVWCQNGSPKCSLGTNIWTSGNVTAYSDIRVKENIELIPNALDKVSQLNGYTFDRTDVTFDEHGEPETPVRQTGVIAQEVLEVLPEAVLGDEEGHYSVAYGNMVGLLIEAVKELKAEVDELKGDK